ncbi:MAG: response regulator [Candidatus Omnitrophica bacterium]|nr:response regulator [Candidatus Omnitrophota bacterium]
MKILLVDKDRDFLDQLSIRLYNYGYQTDFAESVAAAEDRYMQSLNDQERIGLIIFDLDLTEQEADLVLKQLRSMHPSDAPGGFQPVPVIFLTASAGVWFESLDKRFDDFIVKPYDIVSLIKVVKSKMALFQERDHS